MTGQTHGGGNMIAKLWLAFAIASPTVDSLEIACSCHVASWPMGSKSFVIKSDGSAEYYARVGESEKSRTITVTKEQMAELDRSIRDAEFYSLPEITGMCTYSTSVRQLKVKRNGAVYTVMIFPVFNDALSIGLKDQKSKDELVRAEKVWDAVWKLSNDRRWYGPPND